MNLIFQIFQHINSTIKIFEDFATPLVRIPWKSSENCRFNCYFNYDYFWSYIWFCSVLSVIALMANAFQEVFRLLSDFQMPGMLSMEDEQIS